MEKPQQCSRVTCAPHVDLLGTGPLLNTTLVFEQEVTVACNSGFRAFSPSAPQGTAASCPTSYSRRCNWDGQLSNADARCVATTCVAYGAAPAAQHALRCNDPAACGPALGTVIAQVLNASAAAFGDSRAHTCNRGYVRKSAAQGAAATPPHSLVPPTCGDGCVYAGGDTCVPASCAAPDRYVWAEGASLLSAVGRGNAHIDASLLSRNVPFRWLPC